MSLRRQKFNLLRSYSPVLIFFLILIAAGAFRNFQTQSVIRQYREAPNCTPTSLPSSPLRPCSVFPMRVIDKDSYGTHNNGTKYDLTLRPPQGRDRTVGLVGHLLWDQTHIGDTVTAQFWKGKIVQVSNEEYNTETENHPEYGTPGYWSLIIVGTIGALLWVYIVAKMLQDVKEVRDL